jgi:signal transduction histidine kinase/CheY-like chemotaxis protein
VSRAAADVSADELQAEQIRTLLHQTTAFLIGNLIGMVVLAGMFWSYAPRAVVLGWFCAASVVWGARLMHYLRFARTPDPGIQTLLGWGRSWHALVLMQGALWGVAAWAFYGRGTTFHTVGLIVTIYSFCVAAVHILSIRQSIFLSFVALALGTTMVRVASDTSQPWHWQLAGILALFLVMTALMGRAHRRAVAATMALKVRTERLAAQLRTEKAAADEARRAAEAASRAKTQFFAAASHDLRQPLHALGLFAEALRQRSHDSEAAALVNSINESVDALEGLFGELLDITRIDSGGVDVKPQPVPVRELFARLKLQFEPVAFEKGLELRFHGERHVLQTDPVLVERILRNLLSNAIRYTEDGGVLVSCRSRGERLLLQVWDSGIGIDEAALPRVFEEFYQVQSQRPLEAHDRKGLGLGLAIVKRLAGLLEAPLVVRSVAGRGTVFELLVPPGRAARPVAPSAAASKALIGLTLQGRTIAIVEDELAVRKGLEVLLEGWGAQVLVFESFAAVERWARSGAVPRPELLISDYRLPDQRNGIEAIAAVRQALGVQVPAIVVTGSMMTGHEAEAEAHDFHLLIKPVVPNKLRAMIAFKLGMR